MSGMVLGPVSGTGIIDPRRWDSEPRQSRTCWGLGFCTVVCQSGARKSKKETGNKRKKRQGGGEGEQKREEGKKPYHGITQALRTAQHQALGPLLRLHGPQELVAVLGAGEAVALNLERIGGAVGAPGWVRRQDRRRRARGDGGGRGGRGGQGGGGGEAHGGDEDEELHVWEEQGEQAWYRREM